MSRSIVCILFVGFVFSLSAVAITTGQTKLEFPPVSNNAALQYWHAFALLPALNDEQEKLLDNRATVPLDDVVDKLLASSQTSLMYLHRAAKLQECDWGLDYRDGASMHIPHLAKARTLARIAALDARRAFANGDFDRGRDDAIGMVALARQVGGDHTLVSMLVSYLIEGMTVDVVAPYLPEIDAKYEGAVAAFASLPPSPRLDHGVLCEKRLAYSIIEQVKAAEERNPGTWRKMWKSVLGPDIADPLENVQTFEELVETMENFQHVYDELARLASLSPSQFDVQYPAFVKRAEAANPVAKVLLPAMDKVVAAHRRNDARMAMLLASIAVVESGPEKLADIMDPYGDGPFEYRKLEEGFELSSALREDDKPVTLVVGRK
jgi:hypothetical protein